MLLVEENLCYIEKMELMWLIEAEKSPYLER
jgi:hypothetical protein